MTASDSDFEVLVRSALRPVEPPEELAGRLEDALVNLTEMAADELESWELGAMRDPRNWVRPVAAVVVGATAGTALMVLRVRSRRRAQSTGLRRAVGRTARDAAEQARRAVSPR
jgi:hypothetical protein